MPLSSSSPTDFFWRVECSFNLAIKTLWLVIFCFFSHSKYKTWNLSCATYFVNEIWSFSPSRYLRHVLHYWDFVCTATVTIIIPLSQYAKRCCNYTPDSNHCIKGLDIRTGPTATATETIHSKRACSCFRIKWRVILSTNFHFPNYSFSTLDCHLRMAYSVTALKLFHFRSISLLSHQKKNFSTRQLLSGQQKPMTRRRTTKRQQDTPPSHWLDSRRFSTLPYTIRKQHLQIALVMSSQFLNRSFR